jgi:hypothetical protein
MLLHNPISLPWLASTWGAPLNSLQLEFVVNPMMEGSNPDPSQHWQLFSNQAGVRSPTVVVVEVSASVPEAVVDVKIGSSSSSSSSSSLLWGKQCAPLFLVLLAAARIKSMAAFLMEKGVYCAPTTCISQAY